MERKAFLVNPKYQHHVPQYGEHDYSADKKKKWWNEKLFLQIQSIDSMYPNGANMIAVPNHKNNQDCHEYPRLSHFMDKL